MWERRKSEWIFFFFLIETQLEEKHVCLCLLVLCSRGKKRLNMPPAEYVCTHRLSMGSRWEDAEMRDGRVQEKGSQ